MFVFIEPQLFCRGIHTVKVVNAAVIDKRLELRCVAFKPVHHVTAERGTGGEHAVGVDVGLLLHKRQPGHQIHITAATPVATDLVGILLPETGASTRIRCGDNVALSSPDLRIPAEAPTVRPGSLRSSPSQKIKGLSKGTRAKVALSLAMAHRPQLLIMDEPTSGLDPLVRREFLESMIDVAAEGRSVLLSSHQVGEVERVADDVIVLMNGKVIAHERLEDLKQSVTEVVLTMPSPTAMPPKLPGEVIANVPFGHEHVWLLRNLDCGALADLCRSQELPPPRSFVSRHWKTFC